MWARIRLRAELGAPAASFLRLASTARLRGRAAVWFESLPSGRVGASRGQLPQARVHGPELRQRFWRCARPSHSRCSLPRSASSWPRETPTLQLRWASVPRRRWCAVRTLPMLLRAKARSLHLGQHKRERWASRCQLDADQAARVSKPCRHTAPRTFSKAVAANASLRKLAAGGPPRPNSCIQKSASFSGGGEWSGREDLNLRPHGPEPCALPG